MADLAASITTARNAGYSDADITAYLAKDPTLGPQVAQARKVGYADNEIVDHLATPKPAPSFLDEVGGAVSGAVSKLKSDVRSDYAASKTRGPSDLNPFAFARDSADSIGRTARLVGDVANVPGSAVSAAVHNAFVRPVASAATKALPFTNQADNERILNTAMMGMGPEAGAARVAAAPRAGALADTVAQFDRAGVSPMLAANGGKGASTMANVVAENPLAGAAVRGRLRRAVEQTGTSADNLAQQYGATRGPQITGENVQQGVKTFAQDKNVPTSFAAKAGQNYDDVFGKLDAAMTGKTAAGSSQIATPATTTALNDINNSTQSAAVGKLVADPTLGKVAQTLTDAAQAKDMSFGDLRRLRTWVRDARQDPDLRQKIGTANLSRLEGALTQDIYGNAERLGSPQLNQQLRRADQYYAAGSRRIDTALQPFADTQSGESAYARVVQAAGSTSTADAQRLLSLKRSLAPNEWGDVAANVASELGKQTAGNAPAGGQSFSVGQFVTNYNKLSPRGKEILFGSVGGGGSKATSLRAELDNLAQVADKLKTVEKGANTSKTFVNAQAAGTLAGLVNPSTTVPTAAGLSGMAVTGELLTNPVAVRWLARLGRARSNPAALKSVAGQLRVAASANVALLPLYRQTTLMLEAPKLATPVAATPEQQSDQ